MQLSLSVAHTCAGLAALAMAQDGGLLSGLTRPQEGRSMRASSTFREGKDGKYDSKAFPRGDLVERSNSDNFRVAPGATHVLMDVQGPGEITHMWMTFLGPDTPPLGERKNIPPLTQNRIAATLAALLGEDYTKAVAKAGPPLKEVLR